MMTFDLQATFFAAPDAGVENMCVPGSCNGFITTGAVTDDCLLLARFR